MVASALLAAVALAFAWANRGLPVDNFIVDSPKWMSTQNAISAVMFSVPGWYLATRRPRVPFGWLLLSAGLGHAFAGAGWGYFLASEVGGHHYPQPWLGIWSQWAMSLEVPALAAIYLLYPDAEHPRGVVALISSVLLAMCVAGIVSALMDPLTGHAVDPAGPIARIHNPIGTDFFEFDGGGVLWFAPLLTIATGVLAWRWYRARGELRQVLGWLMIGSIPGYLVLPFTFAGPAWQMVVAQLPTIPLIAAVVAGSLRHRVYGIEVVVSRAFLYAILAAVVAGVYGLVVAIGAAVAGSTSPSASFLAALTAAFLLAPARQRIERLVNRLLFGQRDEPYAVLSGVAARLETTGTVERLLPEFTDQVAAALRVPYVAIAIGDQLVLEHFSAGSPVADPERFPLIQQGARIGTLLVGHRAGERAFSRGEVRLLEDLARQASTAVANLLLTEDLKRSRERIVTAREEERRRLRRDLHDGLGPVLSGAAMMIDAGRNLVELDRAAADQQLSEARTQVRSAIEDIRRLVYALRPPALDELGLVAALREQGSRSSVAVVINADEPFPQLPAAVEVAAYRIVSEAMTNAARHAHATTCSVDLRVNGALEIDVVDDGMSASSWQPGVGIVSMRERAAELGGVCEIGPGPDGHGRVHARIPTEGIV
jgi:signal transduction histidine kinase